MAGSFLRDVELTVPDDWADFSVVTLVAKPGGKFRANAVVTSDELPQGDAGAYAKQQIKALKGDAPGLKVHVDESGTVAGRPGHVLEYTFRSPEGATLRQRQLYAAKDRRVFTLSLTHLDEEFEDARPLFEQIAKSFRIA